MRKKSFVTFRINQEMSSVKLIVCLTSMIRGAEKSKMIEPRNAINTEEI